jgi:nicotinate-nucleotide adenylyltransferase
MRTGLMGGTFDPIHYGHLFIAEAARLCCGLDKVTFVPNHTPPHRQGKTAWADPAARVAMTEAAIRSNPCFELSRIEIDRPGPSYAFDTISHFRGDGCGPGELFFIVGADSLSEVLTWHRGAELFEMCKFAVAARSGIDLQQVREQFSPRQMERIVFMEVPALHHASRDLRRRIRDQQPVRYLLPDEVIDTINERGLYREECGAAVQEQGVLL